MNRYGKKYKRVMAVVMALLLGGTSADFGTFPIHAASRGRETIVEFRNLPEKVRRQELEKGAEESAIVFPENLEVILEIGAEREGKAATRSSLGKKKASPSSAESRIVEDDEKEPDEVPLINDLKDIIQSKMRSEAWRPPFAPMTVYAAATPSTVMKMEAGTAAEPGTSEMEKPAAVEEEKTASGQKKSEEAISGPIQREAVLENISWELDEDRSSRHQFSSEKPGDVFVYIPVIPEKYAVDADAKLPAVTVRIVDKKTGYPGFEMSRTVGGVKVTVSADEGVFPEDAVLSVTQVPIRSAEEAGAAVEKERDSGKTVAVSYTFDIRVLDKDGNELQPGEEGKVRVSFAMAETADRNLETDVYHIREDERSGDLTAEKLESEVDERTETVTAETDGFSLYTVEFTYNSLQYVMPGGTVVPLADVLDTVGLTGTVSAVEVSDSTLFSATNESGAWVVTSHQPFSSTEWMKVTIGGIVYEITVTDVNVSTWAGLQAAFTAGNDVTLTGNVTAAASDERLSIPAGVNITLDLNGHTINRNRTAQESNGHVISLSGTLTLKDSVGGGTIKGGNNSSTQGGGIVVFNGGKLIMQGGTIRDNTASLVNTAGEGGGVCVMSGGTFTMSGGTIDSNTAGSGGGVYVASGATFTMSGGTISNNHADISTFLNSQGGGVFVAGTFTMNGGTITGNSAGTHGAGINMYSEAVVTINKGTISNNTAGSSGGGIACTNNGTTNINGGSIINNNCGSVGGGINAFGTFNLKGAPNISGNKCGSNDSNLYAGMIHVVGALTNTTPIGVTTRTTPTFENEGIYFTNGLETTGNATYAKFKSDSEKYYMGEYEADTGKEATLYPKYEIYMNCTSMEYFTPTTPYYQYVVPGSAMTETVFTANTNYGFSTGYSGTTVNGITAERISQTQVRVSGTPTGNNQRIEIPLYRALHLYTVSITAGSNMTKTSGSGAASQTVASGDAITSVVYQAKSGYQFPTDYSSLGTTYGVTVTRDSASQITISGTPTATKNIALAEPTAIGATAPTITSQPVSLTLTYGYSSTPLTLSAGMISGHTLSYQWQSSTNGSSWSNISGATSQNYSIPTGYSVGIKYYRCRVTATRNDNSQTASTYSNSATVTISPRTAALSWSNTSLTYNRSSQKPTCKVSNLVSGDSCTVTVGGAQTNAGNNYTATATALSNSNYKLPTANTTSFTIAKKPVTLNWTNTSFTYDGNNHVPTATAAGVINGDTCNVTVTGEASSVGTHTATAESLSNSNYQLPASKTQSFTIGTRTVTVSGITAENKVYDGGTAATLDYSGVTFDGIVSGDTLTVTATGTFGDKNAETGKTVSISGLTLGGASAGSYVLAGTGNQTQTTADITPKEVGLAWGETSFIYDGAEHLPEATATGLVDGDSCTVTVSGSATAPGTHTATAESLSNSNYQLPATKTQSFTIGTRTVTVSGITAESRVYDGTTAAALDYSGVTFDGLVSGDTLTVTAAGTFSDKNAGTGKTVSISGLTLGGADAGSYMLADTGNQTETTADITPKEVGLAWGETAFTYDGAEHLPEAAATGVVEGDTCTVTVTGGASAVGSHTATAESLSNSNYRLPAEVTQTFTIGTRTVTVSGITAESRVYDSTTAATLDYSGVTFDGLVSGDTLTVTAAGTFSDKNAGTGKTVSISGLTLGGADAGSYMLADTGNQTETTADITPKEVGLTWGETAFTYDGAEHLPEAAATGLVDGDSCTVTVSGSATAPGTHTATAESLSNSNYQLPAEVTQSFTIGTRTVTVSGITAENKVYDGTSDAVLDYSGAAFEGIIPGDTLTVTAAGSFDSADTAYGKTVSISGLTLGGADAGSYVLADTGNQTETTADITPKEVVLTWGENAFTYDGAEHVPEVTATGLVDGDSCTVTVGGAASAPGSHTATAESLSNSNYQLPAEVTQSFTIGTRTVTVSGITAENRDYDGTTAVKLNLDNVVIAGLVDGDTVTVTASGSFADAAPGTGKTVYITGLALGGANADRYLLAASGNQETTTADIIEKTSPAPAPTPEPAPAPAPAAGAGNRWHDRTRKSGGRWNQENMNWTYRLSDGRSATGWNLLSYNGRDDWYFFGSDGYMQTGWVVWNGFRYYLNPVSDGRKGAMYTGWHLIDGIWYYFEAVPGSNLGHLYVNTITPDGYYVDENGAWIPGR